MSTYNTRRGSDVMPSADGVVSVRGFVSPGVEIIVPPSVLEEDMGCGGRKKLSVRLMDIHNDPESNVRASELGLLCAQCAVNDVCLLGRARKK